MNDHTETAEAFLSAALEERAGGHHPPDLTERVLARAGAPVRRRPGSLLAAATLLLGGGVLAAVFLWPERSGGDAAVEQEPQDPAPLEIVQPADVDDWRRLLAETRAISARVFMLPGSRIPIAGVGRPAPPQVPLADGERARALAGTLARLEPRGYDGPWEVSHALRLRLDGRRAVLLELQCTSRPWVARVPDLGFVVVDPELQLVLRQEIDAADRRTKIATGIVGADDLQGGRYPLLSDDVTVLRPYELEAGQIAVVLRYRALKELDLRGSPAVHEPEALARLAELPELASLCLDVHWAQPEDVAALGGVESLTELRLALSRPSRTGDRPLGTDVVLAMLELDLPACALPGEMVTDQQVALLAGTATPRTLDLTRLGPAPVSVTPEGFEVVKNPSLRGLILDGWFAEPAGFGFTSFGLGAFADTDGDGLPDKRLPENSALDPAWVAALTNLLRRSSLRMLSLRGCPRITSDQIEALRAASPRCRIVR